MSEKRGVVGIGIGGRLTGLLKLLQERHGGAVEIRALADESAEALEASGGPLGGSLPRYLDYRRMLDEIPSDWAVIGSKNSLHGEHCVEAFRRGRHVFCEKPFAVTIDQCEQIRAAHLASGRTFMTGFVLRYAPLYQGVRNLVASGAIGRIVSFEATEHLGPDHGGYIMRNWRRFRHWTGPHLLEKCSHDIDLLHWIVGSVPSRVASFAGLDIFVPANKPAADGLSRPDDNPPLYRSWPAWEDIDPFMADKDTEDNQVAILEFRNGVRGTFATNCCSAYPQRRLMLFGVEGTIEADLAAASVRWRRIGRKTEDHRMDLTGVDGHGGADHLIVDDLAQCIATGKEPDVTGEEGFVSAITCLAIDEAYRTGAVVDVEPYWKRFGV